MADPTSDIGEPAAPSLSGRLVRLAILLLAGSGLWLTWMATSFNGLTRMESFHFAQTARNFAEGEGFTSSVILPAGLEIAPAIEGHPDLMNPPLFVIWEGFWFAIFHAGGRVAALASGTAWLLSLFLLYGFAQTLLGRKRAWLAVALFMLNPAVLQASVEGLSFSLTMALVTGCFWCMAAPPKVIGTEDPIGRAVPRRAFFGATLLAGLALLADYDVGWALIPALILFWIRWTGANRMNRPLDTPGLVAGKGRLKAWFRQRPAPRLALDMMLALLLVTLPWTARTQLITGQPLYTLHDYALVTHTETYPGLSVFRHFEKQLDPPIAEALELGGEVWTKGLAGLSRAPGDLATGVNVFLLVLFGAGCLLAGRGKAGRLSRYLLLVTILLAIRNSFYTQQPERYTVLAPVLTVLGLATIWPRLRRLAPNPLRDRRRKGRVIRALWRSISGNPRFNVGLLLVLGSLVLFFAFRFEHPPKPRMEPSQNLVRMKDETPLKQAVITVSPWMVNWFAKLPAIWMPDTKTSFQNLEETFGPEIEWLYFPEIRAVLPSEDMPDTWLRVLQAPAEFGPYKPTASTAENEWLFRKE